MNKLHFLVLKMFVLVLVLTACNKMTIDVNEDFLIKEFLESEDFKNNCFLSNYIVDLEKSTIQYVNDVKKRPVISIFFSNNGQIIGSVEAIKNISDKIKLPNENKYFMFYHDYKQFDFNTLTGSISLYDLNYDNHFFAYGEIRAGELDVSFYNPIPSEIIQKYDDVISFNRASFKSIKSIKNENVQVNPCDGNSDGNVSYSECYKCFNNACATDETCMVLCYLLGDAIGTSISPVKIPWCQMSIAASCIYISIEY